MSEEFRPPTGEEVAAAIRAVHKARQDAWPEEELQELQNANVPPMTMLALVAGYGQMRTKWLEKVEELIEQAPLVPTIAELEQWEREFVAMIETMAREFRSDQMMSLLDPDEDDSSGPDPTSP